MIISILLQASTAYNFDDFINILFNKIVVLGMRIIAAAIFYFIARWAIFWIRKVVQRILIRKRVDGAVRSFVSSTVGMALKIIMVIVIIGILGVETTSFAAILAAAGLAVGMAMKDNLSNFAGGVMILINKPFHLGDRIVSQSMDGTVKEIGILYTVLLTADNRTIYLPNGPLSTGSIINYSSQENRRVDIILNFNTGNDVDRIKALLHDIVEANEKILKTPASFIGVTMLNNGNFDMSIRTWVVSSDYGAVNISLNESIYRKLAEEGIYTSSTLTVKLNQ